MRITWRGQVTIPAAIREKLGLVPGTEVDFRVAGNSVRLVKVQRRRRESRGAVLVARLRGSGDARLSTDEIMSLTRGTRRP